MVLTLLIEIHENHLWFEFLKIVFLAFIISQHKNKIIPYKQIAKTINVFQKNKNTHVE